MRQPFFLRKMEGESAENAKNSAQKLRGTSYRSKKVRCFLNWGIKPYPVQKGGFQPACLCFMMQLQNVIRHAHKLPFRLNIVVSPGQKTTEIHIFPDRGKHTFCLNGTVDPKQNALGLCCILYLCFISFHTSIIRRSPTLCKSRASYFFAAAW